MNKIAYCNKSIHIWILAGIFTMLLAAGAGAGEIIPVKMTEDTVVTVELNARVMEVNTTQSYIVIAEKRFEVTPFIMEGQAGKTLLADKGGNPVELDFYKKGQRVFVQGFEFADGIRYVAEKIQLISESDAKKDYRKIKRIGTQ